LDDLQGRVARIAQLGNAVKKDFYDTVNWIEKQKKLNDPHRAQGGCVSCRIRRLEDALWGPGGAPNLTLRQSGQPAPPALDALAPAAAGAPGLPPQSQPAQPGISTLPGYMWGQTALTGLSLYPVPDAQPRHPPGKELDENKEDAFWAELDEVPVAAVPPAPEAKRLKPNPASPATDAPAPAAPGSPQESSAESDEESSAESDDSTTCDSSHSSQTPAIPATPASTQRLQPERCPV